MIPTNFMGFSEKWGEQPDQVQPFHPCQIVCLDHEKSRLYAEVIQTIERRWVCWVRPLALVVEFDSEAIASSDFSDQPEFYDLRQDSDLLFPVILFRAALDTEMIPLLTFLYRSSDRIGGDPLVSADADKVKQSGHEKFRQFIQQVWNAYPEAF